MLVPHKFSPLLYYYDIIKYECKHQDFLLLDIRLEKEHLVIYNRPSKGALTPSQASCSKLGVSKSHI